MKHHIIRIKDKDVIIISIKAKKAFDKIYLPSLIKPANKTSIETKYLNPIKDTYKEPIANIIL